MMPHYKSILFVTYGDCFEASNGGATFSREVISTLERAGFGVEVVSFYEVGFFKSRLLRKLLAIFFLLNPGLPLPVGYFYSATLKRYVINRVRERIRSTLGMQQYVMVEHLELCYIIPELKQNFGTNVRAFHVSQNNEPALFNKRLQGSLIYKVSEFFSPYYDFEKYVLSFVDGVFSISESEKKHFSDLGHDFPVYVIPPVFCYKINNTTLSNRNNDVHKLVFLANFRWSPNVDAYLWIINELLPLLDNRYKIHIYGRDYQSLPKPRKIDREKIIFHGFVDDIHDVWDAAFFSLAPMRFGGGVNIKVAESLHNKVPVLGSEVAADGLPAKFSSGLVVSELDAKKWCDLLNTYADSYESYRTLVKNMDYPDKDENASIFSAALN